MKVLITGGSGFIGSHSAFVAKSRGIHVETIDLSGEPDYKVDISKIDWASFNLSEFDAVIHLAALISVPESFEIPENYFEVNVNSTERLFSACVEQGVKRVIFASSAAVYGSSPKKTKIIGQEAPPESPYAETKLAGEKLASHYSTRNTNFTVFRFFNVYGGDQSSDSQYASVIPKFIHLVCNNEPITIEGDGLQTRDFIHVSDVVKTLISACSIIPESPFEIINLGTGKGTSISEFASLLMRLAFQEGHRYDSNVVHLEPRVGDVRDSLADLSGLENYIDHSSFQTFEEGIRDILNEELKRKYGTYS